MPIYNNPAVGQAFSNIAGMFAPPDGQDAAVWATANARRAEADAKRAEADRLAWLFDHPLDATASERSSLLGVQNYGATPDGFSATNSTIQRGQDIDSGDKRYGVDVGARTTLATNAATVAGGVTQARLGGLAGLYQPLNPGQVRPELPAEIATQFGAPGAIGAAAGAPKPLSETEMLGAIIGRQDEGTQDRFVRDKFAPTETQVAGQDRRRLVDSGAIGQDDLADLIMGERSPVEAIGPGGSPVFMSPGAAVRTGAQPYVKPTTDSSTEISRLIAERDALPAGNPNRTAYDQRIQALGRGQQQSAYDKTDDENLATLNADIYKAGTGAVGDRTTLTRLQEAVANPDTPQGAMAGTNLALRKTLTAFGVPAGDTSEAEMINALGNQLALRLRDPSNGAGMPGSLSDSDRNFLQSMAVSLGNSPEANKKLVAYYLRLQSKNIDLENIRRDYVKDHGRLDEGFRSLVGDYLQKTGIYAEGGGSAPGGPAGAGTPAAAVPATGQTFDTPGGPVRFRRLD